MHIITITLNPALDRVEYLEGFSQNALNRPYRTLVKAGGKGVNVARGIAALRARDRNFQIHVTALTVLGGHTGEEMKAILLSENDCPEGFYIDHRFVHSSYPTRQAIKLVSPDGTTEINEEGRILAEDLKDLIDAVADLLAEPEETVVVLSGSMPKVFQKDFSTKENEDKSFPHFVDKNVENFLITLFESCEIPVVVDTSGESLVESLKASPSLIKPNEFELSTLVGRTFSSEEEAVEYCRELYVDNGSEILLTRGEKGTIFVGKEGIFKQPSHRVFPCDPTGAGDRFLAAFLYAVYGKRYRSKDALCYAEEETHRYLVDSIPQ